MNRNVYKALRASMIAVIIASPLTLQAQTADALAPECKEYASGYQQKVAEAQSEAERRAAIMDKLKKQPDWMQQSDGLLTACNSANWPKIQLSNSLLSQILSGAQDKAAKAACDQARKAVSAGSSSYKDLMGGSSSLGSWSGSVPQAPSTGTSWGSLGGVQAPSQPGNQTGIPGITPPKP